MSDYPSPETLSHQDLGLILNKLRLLLENLPNQLPSKPVNGPDRASGQKLAFAIDPQIDINSRALLDMISEEAVVASVDQSLLSARAKTATDRREISIDEAFEDW